MRKYNPNVDESYSPDNTPDLYLDDDQVESVLNEIPEYAGESETAVRKLLREQERINKMEKLAKLSAADSLAKSKKLADGFLAKYGYWPYVTKTYEAFYRKFEK